MRQKVRKTAVLGSPMQTVRIVMQNFRFYAINALYCIKKYVFCAIGVENRIGERILLYTKGYQKDKVFIYLLVYYAACL
jgi:hypothetical protein